MREGEVIHLFPGQDPVRVRLVRATLPKAGGALPKRWVLARTAYFGAVVELAWLDRLDVEALGEAIARELSREKGSRVALLPGLEP